MVYGIVKDVTSVEEPNSSQPPAISTSRRAEDNGIDSHKEEPDDNFVDDTVVGDNLLAKLRQRIAEDSPEIFKRVRFITRWQDFEESRGSLYWSSGTLSCWCCTGPASNPARQAG